MQEIISQRLPLHGYLLLPNRSREHPLNIRPMILLLNSTWEFVNCSLDRSSVHHRTRWKGVFEMMKELRITLGSPRRASSSLVVR
jgi:hypothetical protein